MAYLKVYQANAARYACMRYSHDITSEEAIRCIFDDNKGIILLIHENLWTAELAALERLEKSP